MEEKRSGNGKRQSDSGNKGAKRAMGSKRVIYVRTVILMLLCGICTFVPLLSTLWDISVVNHDSYSQYASNQQTRDVEVSADRGAILDTNGTVLAMSATVYNLILSPLDVEASVSASKYTEDGVLDEVAYNAAIAARRDTLIDGLVEICGLDRENLESRMEKLYSQYEVLKTNIEQDEAELLRAFLLEQNCGYDLYLTPSSKRYYPHSDLAAHVVGFVNSEGGAYGIEAVFESALSGVAGRVVSTKTGTGVAMYDSYSSYIDATDGYDVTLTIDANIQYYAERILAEGIEEFDVTEGGFCIVMNPQTGDILAMASSPDYDLNSYSLIFDSDLQEEVADNTLTYYEQYLTDASYADSTQEEILAAATSTATSAARNTQWRSQAINDTYEPGSTFKALVLAAALEEGAVSEDDHFFCTGSYTVNGVTISCSQTSGHGDQTLAEAVQNSCNPAFMMIGQALGAETFYDYFEAFGLTESTGIELVGEGTSIMFTRDYFTSLEGYLSLATASFGQRFTVTPLQMITGFAATINGGYLVTPHVVQSISDENGTIVEETEVETVRQVVSEETSAICRDILESVVSEGTGGKAYVAGYSIGGKTGTSETTVEGEVVVSFMGFAPADDPQVLVLLGYNTPNRVEEGSNYSTTGVYISGGNMAAPKAGELIEDILDYMGVSKVYTAEEAARADVWMPSVVGGTVSQASTSLGYQDLLYRTVGEGDTVTAQIPAAGTSIPAGSTVILYLGDESPPATATVPDLSNLDYDGTKAKLEAAGLFMRVVGSNQSYGSSSVVESQSVAAGETVAMGTVIDVGFLSEDIIDGFIFQ